MNFPKLQLTEKNEKIIKAVAGLSAIVFTVVALMLIINFIQIKTADPLQIQVVNGLVERLQQNPQDSVLRNEIRTIDLLSRKAFFGSLWHLNFSIWLLLLSGLAVLVCFQLLKKERDSEVLVEKSTFDAFSTNSKARTGLLYGVSGLAAVALLFSYLSFDNMQEQFKFKEVEQKLTATETSTQNADNVPVTELVIPDSIANDSASVSEEIQQKETKKVLTEADFKANYPNFRGFGGNGISFHKNIPSKWNGKTGENLKWKTPIPLKGYNSPIIWDDFIFLSGANATSREIYCFNKNKGELLWTHKVTDVPNSPATAPKVTEDTGFAAATVATDGNNVYAIFANGDLCAVDFSGKRVWAKNLGLPQNHYGHSSSLIVHKNKLLVQFDQSKNAKLIAFDTQTGNEIYSIPRNVKISWSSPVLVNTGSRNELILVADPDVVSYNPDNGKELWRQKSVYGEVGPSVAYTNGIVFAVNEYAKLEAIKVLPTPQVLWENDEYLSDVASPVAYNNLLFLATSFGAVVCYDAETGEKYWEHDFPKGFYASPIVADGKVYMLDKDGVMQIIKADKEYSIVAQSPIGEPAFATPAFTNLMVFVRTDKFLYAIGK